MGRGLRKQVWMNCENNNMCINDVKNEMMADRIVGESPI